jgi:hypothetical protein
VILLCNQLFDSQAANGNVASGASKESAVEQAASMALKMYLKSQGSGGGGVGALLGGGGSNMSGLMGLASKFL